jgi:hypothetical protein
MVRSLFSRHLNVESHILRRANRAQYAEVSYRTVSEGEVVDVSLPSTQGATEDEGMIRSALRITSTTHLNITALDAMKALTLNNEVNDVFTTPDQLDEELVTLTLLPRSRWQTLLSLDVIQVTGMKIYPWLDLTVGTAAKQAKRGSEDAPAGTVLPPNITGCRT